MREIIFSCPHCGQSLSAEPDDIRTETECPSCSTAFTVPKTNPSTEGAYQIDDVTLMHETGSSGGSILITQNQFLFLSKSTVMSVELFGITGSAIGSLFATSLGDKLNNRKQNATPLTEQELIKQSGDRHVDLSEIRKIKVQKKMLGGISLHVHTEKKEWGPYFSFVGIPTEYSIACKQQGMEKGKIREQFQNEVARVLTESTGVTAQITKGLM